MAVSAITAAATTTSRHPLLSPYYLPTTLTLLIKKHRPRHHPYHYHYHSRYPMTSSASIQSPTPEQKIIAPYGSWSSPITSDVVSGASKGLGGTTVDSHGRLFWLESRPTESGYVC